MIKSGDYMINKVELGIYTITDKGGAIVYVGHSFEECAEEISSGRLEASLKMCDLYCD